MSDSGGMSAASEANIALRVAAAELGRRGGQKGGRARADKLTPERRKLIAKTAAMARWGRARPPEMAVDIAFDEAFSSGFDCAVQVAIEAVDRVERETSHRQGAHKNAVVGALRSVISRLTDLLVVQEKS